MLNANRRKKSYGTPAGTPPAHVLCVLCCCAAVVPFSLRIMEGKARSDKSGYRSFVSIACCVAGRMIGERDLLI